MEGHVHLTAARDHTGGTYLREQSFAAPIHISKPHREGSWLVVNLVSPTPGLFAGDRITARVSVEKDAHLLLTAPSACRVHTMRDGQAELTQDFQLAAGASLDVWPEYLIPQAQARYHQRTRIDVERGATLLWTETIAPGRVARGECFAFQELSFALDAFHAGRQLVRERYRWEPDGAGVPLRRVFASAYYASILAIHPDPAADQLEIPLIHDLHDPALRWVGVTRLSPFAVAVKIVAADSPTLRATVSTVRSHLQRWLGMASPSLRRITGAPTA